MRDSKYSSLLVYRDVAGLSATSWPTVLVAIAVYTWEGGTHGKLDELCDRHQCVTWRENDAIKRGNHHRRLEDGPEIRFAHYLMHSVVPDASVRVTRNIRARAERRLRGFILCTCFGSK